MGAVRILVWPLVAVALGACARGEGGMLRGSSARTVRAPAPSAAHYSTRPSDEPVVGEAELAAAVRRGVGRAGESHGVEVRGDGRLGLLAAWTAEHLGEGGTPPPHEVVEFFAHHLGLVEPTPHLLLVGQPDASAVEDAVADSVSQFLAREHYNHYGAAVVERQGLTLTVVTLSARWLELEPLPRRVAAGTPLEISGRLLAGYRDPTLVIAEPGGHVERRPLGQGIELQARYEPEAAGTHAVEILARGPRGDSVVANFPVYVGTEVPSQVSLSPDEGASRDGDAGGMATSLLRLLNRTRAEAGLPPLALHEDLSEVARAHSRDMVDNEFIGHTSPTEGSAPQRVARAGFKSGLVLENIGRGYGANEIHRGLLQSPGHRANILNPDVTHVGIGVVTEQEDDRTAFVVTQIFVRMASEVDVQGAPAWLLERINQGRSARGTPPLEMDENLQEAAQRGAHRFFEEPSLEQRDVVEEASAGLRRLSIAYQRVGGVMVVVEALDEATRLEPLFDPEVRHVGIGVAQGSRPDAPPNAVAVVVMLGWPR
ncbi:MAG: CAP domain-containing protein [Myxococcota bacterium]